MRSRFGDRMSPVRDRFRVLILLASRFEFLVIPVRDRFGDRILRA